MPVGTLGPGARCARGTARFPRRHAEAGAERTAEVGRILEPPRLRDVSDRLLRFRGIAQVVPAALEASVPDEVVDRVVDVAHRAVQAALGGVEVSGYGVQREFRVMQMLRDVLADPGRQRALSGLGRQFAGALVDCQGDQPAEAIREIIGAHHVEGREFLPRSQPAAPKARRLTPDVPEKTRAVMALKSMLRSRRLLGMRSTRRWDCTGLNSV